MLLGVVHHLDTDLATQTINEAGRRLNPNGRLVTLDPVFHPDQQSTARVLMALDRGLYARHPEDYERIVRRSFAEARVAIRSDLTPFPYTHCIIEAERPLVASTKASLPIP